MGGDHVPERTPIGGSLATRSLRVAVLVGAALVIPAIVATSPAVAIDELDCEPSPAARQDIATMAEQEGIAMDEAIARYGWQQCFSELVADVQATYPRIYAGAAIVDDGRRAWIAFTDRVPDEVVERAAQIPVPVQLLDDREVSEGELNEALQALHGAVSQHEDVVTASGSFDVETAVITIRAQPADGLSEAERDRLLATLRATSADHPAISVDVALVDEVGGGEDESDTRPGLPLLPVAAVIVALGVVAVVLAGRHRRRSSTVREDRA